MSVPSSWRITAFQRADRLSDEIAELTPPTQTGTADTAKLQAQTAVQEARAALTASQKAKPLARLWNGVTGSDVEYVWMQLHLSEEQLVLAADDATLAAQQPYFRELATKVYSGSRRVRTDAAVKLWAIPIKPADRQLAHDILVDTHAKSDADHQRVRGFRNLLYVLSAILVALEFILWRTHVTAGSFIWLGALGGAVSAVFAFNKSGPATPYNLATPQMLLKIVAGAATAVLALKVVEATQTGMDDTVRQMYAVVFGFSQQAFTFLADNQVAALKKALTPDD
jgi:hypothetical protein